MIDQPNRDLYSLVRKNSVYILLERTIVPLTNVLITVFVIRKLPVDDYGVYNILLALMGYVGLASSLGLTSSFQRYLPEFYQKREMTKLKKLVRHGLLLRLVLCISILVLLMLLAKQIGLIFGFSRAYDYLTLFSIAIVFYLESGLLSIALTAVFYHKNYAVAQILYVIIRGLLLYYFLSSGRGLTGLLIAESISFGILFVILYQYYVRFLSREETDVVDELPVRRLLRYSGFSYFNEVGSQILAVTTDFFVISAFLGPVAVGLYAFANRVVTQLSHIMPHSMFMSVIRPAFFAKFLQSGDPAQLDKMFNLLLKMTAFFAFPLMIGVIVMGRPLIYYVFDSRYLQSLEILWIVAIFTFVNLLSVPIGLVLQSMEKVQILFYSKIFAIYNIIVDILVIRSYGILGIALVTGSAVLFKNMFCYYFARRYASLTLDLRGLFRIFINSLLMGLCVWLLRIYITSVFSFCVVALLGTVVYFVIAYINKAFSVTERSTINKLMPKPYFIF